MGFVVLGLAVAALVYGTMWAEQTNRTAASGRGRGYRHRTNTRAPNCAAKLAQVYPAEAREEDRQDARTALNGAVLQMFNHGLSSAGMFLLAGALYHKAHTRDLRRFGGLWDIIPMFGALLIFVSMASLGLPGLNGFVGEFLVVAGSFRAYPIYVLLSMLGLLITGIYILKAIQMLLHGPYNEEWADLSQDRTLAGNQQARGAGAGSAGGADADHRAVSQLGDGRDQRRRAALPGWIAMSC